MFGKLLRTITNRTPATRIAFDRTGEWVPGCPCGIYTIQPDGSDCKLIHKTGATPRWSPDGRWITFTDTTRDNGGLNSVFAMRSNGEDVRRLTTHHDVSATTPTWSPDSTKIAYSLFLWSEKRYQLCVVDFASQQWTQLAYAGIEIYPVWTPYDTIVFSSPDGEGAVRLYEVDTTNRNPRPVPRFEAGDAEPVWTWDGKWAVFGRDGGFAVMNTGTGESRFFATERTPIQWSISPDGEHVAYTSQEQGAIAGFEVFVIRLCDGFKRKLVSNPIVDDHEVDSRYVSWSPWL